MSYIETPADHAFTAFMASLTPGRVLRDRVANFSLVERKRAKYLGEPKRLAAKPLPEPVGEVVVRDRAAEMRDYRVRVKEAEQVADDGFVFEPWMLAVADRVLAKEEAA